MKREFLEGLGLEKEAVDKIMAENGADLEREKAKTTAAKADLADVQEKLGATQAELDGLKKAGGDVAVIQQQLTELQDKYNTETEQYKAQLAERDYSDAINRAIAGKALKFSSKSAEKAFVAALKEKKLELKDGELSGLDDFIKAQREADPEAFAPDKPAPTFARPAGGGGNGKPKTAGERLAESIGKTDAARNKAANDIISMYTGGN